MSDINLQTIVWIDREHAKIFDLENGAAAASKLRKLEFHPKDHHTHRLEGDEKESRGFYREVAKAVESAAQILILGPGVAKHHFRTHLAEHHPMVLKKVVGCETVDHPTDHQITAFGARFFDQLQGGPTQ